MRVTYLGHAFFVVDTMDTRICIDPFIVNNKKLTPDLRVKYENADYIIFSNAKSDHMDLEILKFCPNATVLSNPEICAFLSSRYGLKTLSFDMNEKKYLDCNTWVARVKAYQSSLIDDNGYKFFAGVASGFIINYCGSSVYYMGETKVFPEMRYINELFAPQVGLVPIGGGNATMDLYEASMIVNNAFKFKLVIPMHYNTFSNILAKPEIFKQRVNGHNVKILQVGERVNF